MPSTTIDVRIEFLSALARSLARCGESSDDMERDLNECAARLGLGAQFYVTPTMVMASFGSDAHERTVLLRVSEGIIDLQARSTMHEIVEGVKAGEKTAAQALAEVNLIAAAPQRFAWWVRVLASGVGAASFAIFLGGGWRTFFAAAVVAISLSLLVITDSRTRDWPIVLAAVVLVLIGSRFGAWLVGASLGVAIASFVLGMVANGYARLSRRPAAVLLIPGLAVLVPGALGLRGVTEFLRDASGGIDVLTGVVIIAAGLVVGLLVADALLPARRQAGRPE